MVFKQDAVELIAAGLGDNGDGRSARHPLFSVEVIRGNIDLLDGLRRRHIHGVVRQPDEHVRGAVHASVVVVAVGAVDVEAQRTLGCIGNSVL